MTRKIAIKVVICMLVVVLVGTCVYAAKNNTILYESNYHNLLSVLIIFLGFIMIGLLIVLIKSYTCFKKEMRNIYNLVADKDNHKNDNVINIRKHNDKELLDKLYSHIDKRLDEIASNN